jgi:hypothetical protein
MVRVQCSTEPKQSYEDGVLASAYKAAEGKLVLVLVNLSQEEQRCDLGFAREFDVYTTCEKANLERTVQSGSKVTLPARAVVTVILS